MKLAFIGPPGSGKGTYAQRVGPKLGIPQISTGDLLREEVAKKTEIGKKIKDTMESGELVSDDIVAELLKKRLDQPDAQKGFILDGYPRNRVQAEALEEITGLDKVVNLVVPDEIVIYRLGGRRTCGDCDTLFNINTMAPKKEGICDECGGELIQRKDDTPEVIKDRLQTYENETKPIIDFYRDKGLLVDVQCDEADIPPEVIVEKIMEKLGN